MKSTSIDSVRPHMKSKSIDSTKHHSSARTPQKNEVVSLQLFKVLCKSQFPHTFVNSSFIIAYIDASRGWCRGVRDPVQGLVFRVEG